MSAIVVPLVTTGCASLVKQLSDGTGTGNTLVAVRSTPSGVTGRLTGGRYFTTPTNLVLRSDQDYTAVLTREGFEPVIVQIQSRFNLWSLANLLTAGLGFLVDGNHGALLTLSPSHIDVDFERDGTSLGEPSISEPAEPAVAPMPRE